MPAIIVKNLVKKYGNTLALNNISFSVKRGEIFGLLGPNGAGKTTVIDILADVLTKDSGQVRVLGKYPYEVKHEMNIVSSYAWLSGILTVYENLKIYAKIYGVKGFNEKIHDLLKLFEITELKNKQYQTLSAGQQIRVNLCKALINEPKVLLLDEFTMNLDPYIANKTRSIIKRLKKDMAILLTSHNMHEVEDLCDRLAFLHRGRIIWQGNISEIKNNYKNKSLEEIFIKIAGDWK